MLTAGLTSSSTGIHLSNLLALPEVRDLATSLKGICDALELCPPEDLEVSQLRQTYFDASLGADGSSNCMPF